MFDRSNPSASLALVLLLIAAAATSGWAATPDESLLERDVLPILTKNCLGCHGGLRQKGGLDLRTIPAMLRGGDSGPALVVGQAEKSELWRRIESDEMPEGEKKLSADEKAVIRTWIAAGTPTVGERHKAGADDPLLSGGKRHSPLEVAATIDRHLERSLSAAKLSPAPASDDAEFLRRVYLDLSGRVPTAEQAAAFLDDDTADKRARLIDELLATAEFGEQFGRTWREWICPPELPSDPNGGKQPHREAQLFGRWIGERAAAGDAWDKIARDILLVEGELKNNPQVVFFALVGEGGRATPAGSARAVSSLFLGVQLQCAECHDDPYRDWSQREHWALAAFFSRTAGEVSRVSEMAPKDKKEAAEIAIPPSAFLNAGSKVPAAFLGGDALQVKPGQPLRPLLVDWMTASDNPYFARAFANRMWFYFFARGLVNPIDDFRELNPPSHPGLMRLLSEEFTSSGYDIKHLVRCICNSQAYQRTSRVSPGLDQVATAELTAAFGRMPLRVMTADQLFDSLKLAFADPKLDLRGHDPQDGNTNGESAPVGDPYLEFLRRFGTNEEDATDFTHGIPQMLTMLNHPRLLAGSLAFDPKARKSPDMPKPPEAAEEVVAWLYLSTLSRRPGDEELADAVAYIGQNDNKQAAYGGVLWMLINRSEFLLVR